MKPYYQTSQFTLYLGDCKEVCKDLKSVDMVFTDPPYGHNNNDGDLIHNREKALGVDSQESKMGSRPIENDGDEANELVQWLFKESNRLLPQGGCLCCCCAGGGGSDPQFARWTTWMDSVLEFKQMIIWDKGPMGMGWHYRRSYETILVGQKKGAKCKWHDESHKVENIIRPGMYGIKKIIPSATDHPTEKPIELAQFFIGLHSQQKETVLDPFMGSGSTMMAAHRLNRKFIGVDISEDNLKIAVDRLKSIEGGSFLMNARKQAKKLGRFDGRTRK